MSLLIKDVQVVDGAGGPPYKADVLVQRNIISAIGNLKRRRAAKEIDGLGNYLAPGFIDVNTAADHSLTLFNDPSQKDFTDQGVTTIIGGHCGASLAPLIYGSLESIRKWADPREINVNWHTTAEFLKVLDGFPLGVNFGTLVGHSTIRRSLMGDYDRRLTLKELAVFEKVLRDSLKEGAFGLSIGLGYVHGRPASPREIRTLVKVVSEFNGIYTTHLRDSSEELLDSITETIKVAKDTGAKTVISHLQPIKGSEAVFDEAMKLIEKSAAKASVYFDIYPYPRSTVAMYTLLPRWAQKGNLEIMLDAVKDKNTVNQIKKDWQKLNFEGLGIANAIHHPYLTGRKIIDADDLIYLMAATGLKATVLNSNIHEESLLKALKMSQAFIASNGNAPANTFPRYLEIAVRETGVPIERAIKKITSDAYSYFGIKKRGVIKEKNIADLVIVGKSDYKARTTILGGKVVGEDKTQGEVLRHKK